MPYPGSPAPSIATHCMRPPNHPRLLPGSSIRSAGIRVSLASSGRMALGPRPVGQSELKLERRRAGTTIHGDAVSLKRNTGRGIHLRSGGGADMLQQRGRGDRGGPSPHPEDSAG